jgi:hypothetical protein
MYGLSDDIIELHQHIKELQAKLDDRDCEIERLLEYAKKGPYDESAAKECLILRAKLDAVTEGLALLADGSTPWMLWRKGEGPGEGRSAWEAMADYAKQLLSAAIGEQE